MARSGVATTTSAAPRADVGRRARAATPRHAAAAVVDAASGARPATATTAQPCSSSPSPIVVPGAARPDQRDGVAALAPRRSMLPPLARTPSHDASASTRSGATSRSGASTKPRSHMRGCGMREVGIVEREVVVEQHVDVERARAPALATHASRVRAPCCWASASSACGSSSVSIATTAFRYASCARTADRSGLVDARDRRDLAPVGARRARRRRAAGGRGDRRGSTRARGRRVVHRFERPRRARRVTVPDVADGSTSRHRRLHLAHLDDRRRATRGSARHTSAMRAASRSSSVVVLRRDDPAHRFADRAVVDGVVELVARARGTEVDEQLEVDLERLRRATALRAAHRARRARGCR